MPRTRPTSADARVDFRACDTTWRIAAQGIHAQAAVEEARAETHALERVLNAFDPTSAVARLNREGRVTDAHVAALVRRAAEYRERTAGAFDVRHGALEHAVKAHIRGGAALATTQRAASVVQVEGSTVIADAPLDLNGIAKGYIVDAAHRRLVARGVRGFVDGGGDIAWPTGIVGIQSPREPDRLLGALDTRWCVATSGNARRRRGAVDHLYDARTGRIGARHDQVTVVARRDCTEADVLATTLAVLPLAEGRALVEGWRGAEALWVDGKTLHASSGFEDHVWKA